MRRTKLPAASIIIFTALCITLLPSTAGCKTQTQAPAETPTQTSPSPLPASSPPEVTPEPASGLKPIPPPPVTTPETGKGPSPAGIPEQPEGQADPDITVDIYHPEKAFNGTTLLPDNHDSVTSRVIEVNMLGEIVWEYQIPQEPKRYTNPGFDVELLENDNILLTLPGKGVYEVNCNGDTLWSYLDNNVSHDADRLPNGNTLVVFGNNDKESDAQVKEISPEGKIVWSWYARDHFYKSPHKDIYEGGWTHTNAVVRLPDGNTIISPRNFNLLVKVDPGGDVVRTIGADILHHQHDPEILLSGNILVANHGRPHRAIELEPNTGKIVWQSAGFKSDNILVRDANRLPNGNTLITGTTAIVEVTPGGEVVWRLRLKNVTFDSEQARGFGFYKAERINQHR
ncbi:aryl-sulfate sulfotransferase [Chloroflexota bacterium]